MNTNQPQLLRKKHIKFNSLHRRLENWLVNYQSTLPIDAQLMFEQLGLEYKRKNYKKFYGALWEINNDETAKVRFAMKDFHFAEFPFVGVGSAQLLDFQMIPGQKGSGGAAGPISSTPPGFHLITGSPDPMDILNSIYQKLLPLSKEERTKIIQSLTIML